MKELELKKVGVIGVVVLALIGTFSWWVPTEMSAATAITHNGAACPDCDGTQTNDCSSTGSGTCNTINADGRYDGCTYATTGGVCTTGSSNSCTAANCSAASDEECTGL